MTTDLNKVLINLPLTNLETAEITNFQSEFSGRITVIDFWTTTCTRCPEALDKLDYLAGTDSYSDIRVVSICCDSCDGARNIIEKDEDIRWKNIHHYHMDSVSKEKAKAALGFRQVPFYVILNEQGEIQQKGSSKQVDLTDIPGLKKAEVHPKPLFRPASPISVNISREFCIEDDF